MIGGGGQPAMDGRPFHSVAGLTIEGAAIVSADGMIADAAGEQPPGLLIDADQRFFRSRLDAADVVVHGRNSGEGGPEAAQRRRIMLTRRVIGPVRDPGNPLAVLWNPSAAPFDAACALVGAPAGGTAVVIGGTDVFGLFLEVGYDVFHLSRAAGVRLPGGRPVFPGVPAVSPEEMLARHGLKPDATRVLDPSAALTITAWRR